MAILYVHSRRATTPCTTKSGKDLLYCSISEPLKTAAATALNAFIWLREEMETFDWKEDCQLQYRTRRVAEQKATLLRDMRLQKEEGVERPDDDLVYREFLVGDTAWLKCSTSELLAMETDFDKLTQEILEAKVGAASAIEKRLKKLVQAYLNLFVGVEKIDPIAGYEAQESTPQAQAWGQEVLQRHEHVVAFLRLFISRCSADKPEEISTDAATHIATIEDLSTVLVDGAPLNLNRARKAALFTLAVLGTDVSDEKFALLYNDELYRNPGRAAKYGNIVAQALSGLKSSLPHLRVTKPRPHRTRIWGVKITSEVSEMDLKEWLHERTS